MGEVVPPILPILSTEEAQRTASRWAPIAGAELLASHEALRSTLLELLAAWHTNLTVAEWHDAIDHAARMVRRG